MRAVIQRVLQSSVTINNEEKRTIDHGLCILLGCVQDDNQEDIDWLVRKISQLRIFGDEQNHMNLSILDTKGSILVISQFTLCASTKKGNRPSFIKAAKPAFAKPLYEAFVDKLSKVILGQVVTGEFGADMLVNIQNNGPVTIIMDTKNKE